jgi:hypothetical protein
VSVNVGPVRRRYVDEALVTMLDAQIPNLAVGLGEAPAGIDVSDPNVLYVVVFPLNTGGTTTGPPANSEADADLDYDIRSIAGLGAGRSRCQWASDEVRRCLFTRSDWGEPSFALAITKHVDIDRSPNGSIGAATLLAGVWQATDSPR